MDKMLYVSCDGDRWVLYDKDTNEELDLSGYEYEEDLFEWIAHQYPQYADYINNHIDELENEIECIEISC